MPAPQTYKTSARWDPPFHFFVLPVMILNVAFAIYATIHHWPDHPHLFPWWIVLSIALFLLALRSRQYALKAQDRVIRLEERLRLAALLPPADLARGNALTESQLIGLRFASDGELPALVRRALDENLTQKQIKEAIVTWKPDLFRV